MSEKTVYGFIHDVVVGYDNSIDSTVLDVVFSPVYAKILIKPTKSYIHLDMTDNKILPKIQPMLSNSEYERKLKCLEIPLRIPDEFFINGLNLLDFSRLKKAFCEIQRGADGIVSVINIYGKPEIIFLDKEN